MISDLVYPELRTSHKLDYFSKDFTIWKHKIEFILTDYGVHYVLTQPKPPESSAAAYQKWLNDDLTCRQLINAALDDRFLYLYDRHPTAKSLFDHLTTRFTSPSLSCALIFFRPYINRRMSEDEHINFHIFKMRALARELETAGFEVPDELQAVILVNSLPDSCEDLVGRLVMDIDNEGELAFDKVSRRLMVAGQMRACRGDVSRKVKKGFKESCYYCGRTGHSQSDCPDQVNIQQKPPTEPVTYSTLSDSDSDDIMDYIVKKSYRRLKTTYRLDYTGSNFFMWEGQIPDILSHQKVKYVLENPEPPKEDANDHKKWLADDLTCRHLILGTMDDDLILSFRDQPTAKTLMDALHKCFGAPSMARRLFHFRKYINHSMSEDGIINDHINKMEFSLAFDLLAAGIRVPDEMQAVVLIDSLPESWYDQVSTMVMHMDMDKEKGLDLVNVSHRLRDIGSYMESIKEEESPNKRSRKAFQGNCYSCGRPGHYRSKCPY